MQKGASMPASELIKLMSRGKTSRLSVEPLLEFFRPLEAWLEAQNRDEPVIENHCFLDIILFLIFVILYFKCCFRSLVGRRTWTIYFYSKTYL
jgi:hypothetical protein